MFAVIKTGGKQYRVAPTDVIRIDRIGGEAGDTVAFDEVMMVGDADATTVGGPLVAGASVAGEIVEQTRNDTILVFKKRRRKNSQRSRGHRQQVTMVRITNILTDGKTPAKAKPAKAAAAEAEKPAEKAAPATEATPAAVDSAEAPATEGADDLKKLSGVGAALEEKLHGLGITTYAQVAAWAPEDVERVDAELNFKGRIEREDWIGQAKRLVEEK